MISNLKLYKGQQIDKEKILLVKDISQKRYDSLIYNTNYKDIDSVEEISFLYGIDYNDLNLILGTNWFLFFEEGLYSVKFLEWVSENNDKLRVSQVVEIMRVFKDIAYRNKDKLFMANMRHDSSYQFYESLLRKNYLYEVFHTIDIDTCFGNISYDIKIIKDKYKNINEYLNSDESKEHPEYLKYIIHLLGFGVTEEFIKRQEKLKHK